jgi:hypothetical protein
MDDGQHAALVRACRDMLADGTETEDVLAIIRAAAGDFGDARALAALVFGIDMQAAHELLADSATWADRREPMLEDSRLLDDFRGGD